MRGTTKIALLGALYFAQGLPFGFQATALPAYLRAQGVSLAAIGMLGALSAPWLLKALWAPWIDRGRRTPWILSMQLLMAISAVVAALVASSASLGALLGAIFAMNLFAATQDIAVDGLAVDLLTEEELGPGNAAQVVGYKLGMLTGGGLLVWASAHIGWQGLFFSIAGLILVVLVISALVLRASSFPPRAPRPLSAVLERLWSALRSPGALWVLLTVGTYKLGETMTDAMFKPFLVDRGYTISDIGLLMGTYGMLFSLAGSAAGGVLAKRSIVRALRTAALLRIAPLVGVAALAAWSVPESMVVTIVCAEAFFGGMLTAALFAFMMSKVDPQIGATHFTLLASLEVLGKMSAATIGGFLAASAGYAWVFATGAVLSLLFWIWLMKMPGDTDP